MSRMKWMQWGAARLDKAKIDDFFVGTPVELGTPYGPRNAEMKEAATNFLSELLSAASPYSASSVKVIVSAMPNSDYVAYIGRLAPVGEGFRTIRSLESTAMLYMPRTHEGVAHLMVESEYLDIGRKSFKTLYTWLKKQFAIEHERDQKRRSRR